MNLGDLIWCVPKEQVVHIYTMNKNTVYYGRICDFIPNVYVVKNAVVHVTANDQILRIEINNKVGV